LVVRQGLPRRLAPQMPWARISRSTVQRATGSPARRRAIPHPPRSVGVVVGLVDLADAFQQPLVAAAAGRAGTGSAVVVGRGGHLQSPADRLDPEAPMAVHVGGHFGRSESDPLRKTRSLTSGSRSRGAARSSPGASAGSPRAPATWAIRTLPRIGLVLAHLLAQRLRMHPEIRSDVRDRPLALKRQTNPALDQLRRILLRSSHSSGFLSARTDAWLQGLRQTRDGSHGLQRAAQSRRSADGHAAVA
jgi:hypothetical protein